MPLTRPLSTVTLSPGTSVDGCRNAPSRMARTRSSGAVTTRTRETSFTAIIPPCGPGSRQDRRATIGWVPTGMVAAPRTCTRMFGPPAASAIRDRVQIASPSTIRHAQPGAIARVMRRCGLPLIRTSTPRASVMSSRACATSITTSSAPPARTLPCGKISTSSPPPVGMFRACCTYSGAMPETAPPLASARARSGLDCEMSTEPASGVPDAMGEEDCSAAVAAAAPPRRSATMRRAARRTGA